MTSKIEKRLAAFQSNAYPAMLADLGRDLGVESDALARLELGWAPVVEFKRGPNYRGWWAIPERDEDGRPVGLALRGRDGRKVMYPGSKHGLTYPVNPKHTRGQAGYKPGAHNWVRTMDAGINCPVCGKPDGCLLHHDNPEDPQAVVCIREISDTQLRFGYLHLLKPEGMLAETAALPPSDYPIIVVEGMTDTATVLSLGLIGVGRPSNMACLDELSALLRNREVVVVGENDEVNPQTGRRPGHEGMTAAFQTLKRSAKRCRVMLPPEDYKDLREWYRRGGLTAQTFLEYIEEHAEDRTEATLIEDNQPYTIAKAFLDAQYRVSGRYILKYHRGAWYKYTGTKYAEIDPENVRGPAYDWARGKMVQVTGPDGSTKVQPLDFGRFCANNITDAMLAPSLCQITAPHPPAWINDQQGPDPSDLIVFSNGILRVSAYLEGRPEDEYLLPLSPDLFTLFALPFPFDPTAECPQFEKSLASIFPDCPYKPRLLQEWFGYCLTPSTSFQKLMVMRGPKASGKSTLAAVLEAIVGEEQTAGTSFRQLMGNFGLQGLVGAQVAIMGDARLPRNGDSMIALETLLKITGEDTFSVDRKYQPPLKGYRFPTKFTLTTNELPELPDHAGAMERRLLILDFPHSFEDKPDIGLKDRLVAEAPGIAVWALHGLKRLWDRGKFTTPYDMLESLREWRTTTSPTAAFAEEVCEDDPENAVYKDELYQCWLKWSGERGMKAISKGRFLERFKAAMPHSHSTTFEYNGRKHSVIRGVALRAWAAKTYLGKV